MRNDMEWILRFVISLKNEQKQTNDITTEIICRWSI